jgi:hypothetical protein
MSNAKIMTTVFVVQIAEPVAVSSHGHQTTYSIIGHQMHTVDANKSRNQTQPLPLLRSKLKPNLYFGPITNVKIMTMVSVAPIVELEVASSLGH